MPEPETLDQKQNAIDTGIALLQDAGRDFHRRGWSLATSSNYSIVLNRDPLQLLMTASGKDKGQLLPTDFTIVDSQSKILRPAIEGPRTDTLKPSAEAELHIVIAQLYQAGSVLHTHSVWATVLSEKYAAKERIAFSGLEILKAFSGVKTHETTVYIPIFPNSQDITALAQSVKQKKDTISHAFLISGHGLYTWGKTFEDAKRHLEAMEFLLEVKGRGGQ